MHSSFTRPVRTFLLLGIMLAAGLGFTGTASASTSTVNCGSNGTSGFFTIDDQTNTITGNTGCTGTAVIPSRVTSIDVGALASATITGVSFAETSSLTSIGECAFCGTTSLVSVTLPNSVTTIGSSAFNGSGVTSVTLPTNSSFTTIPQGMFANAANLASIVIPSNVTTIGTQAFSRASRLSSVTFSTPTNVTTMGMMTFEYATRLTSITIPSGVTLLDNNMFYGATGLTSITIPDTVTSFGGSVFFRASGLTSVTLPTNSRFTSIPTGTFGDATSLQSITIPNSVTSIGSYAFQGATGLTKLTIPSGVTTLGESAFSNMTALTRIEFLGNQPSCLGGYFGPPTPCTRILSGSNNATVYRFANATIWPDITLTYQGRPQAYLLIAPAAPEAVAGDTSATISVTAPSVGPTPTTYTVAAEGDSTKTCTITTPTTSCIINGLTNGTSYTFIAIANTTTPDVSSLASAASNAVTPAAPVNSGTTTGTTTPTTTTTTPTSSTPLPMPSTAKVTSNTIVTTFMAPSSGSVHHVGLILPFYESTRASLITVCTYDKTINTAGVTQVTCKLNNAGRRLRTQKPLVITLTTTFTPTSGTPMVSTGNVRLARTPIAKVPTRTNDKPSAVTG